jgi:hypothetical protein
MMHAVVNLLFGCRHRRITRPMTPVHRVKSAPEPTYVVCLDCGGRLHYDLDSMRLGKLIPKPPDGGESSSKLRN